jgi:hypothetical protein
VVEHVFKEKLKLTHIEKCGRGIGAARDVAVEGRYTRFALLENIWRRMNPSLSNNSDVERFLKEVGKALGIAEDIFSYIRKNKKMDESERVLFSEINDFLRMKEYEEHVKGFKDMSKGQEPTLIYVSNSEYIELSEILGEKTSEVRDGVLHGGVFGTSINIRKPEHLKEVPETDFAEVFYMVGHLSHTGNLERLPYILFIGKYDEQTKDKGEESFKEVVELIKERKKSFIELAVKAGNMVSDNALHYGGRNIPLLSVVYSAHERKFYVITEKGSTEFCEYIKNIGGESEVARKHLEALEKHLNDSAYSNIALFKRFSQALQCVDSREEEVSKFYSVAKIMGGIPSDEEIKRLERHNYALRTDIYLHTNCGYLNVAQDIHYLIVEIIEKLRERTGIPVKSLLEAFVDIAEGRSAKISKKYADELGLPNKSKELFRAIFNEENLNMQNIIRHMFNRGVLKKRSTVIGGEEVYQLYMPAVERVEKSLSEMGYKKEDVGKEFFSYLVLEEVGREQERRIKEKTNGRLNFVILIHSLKTGRVFDIPRGMSRWFVENRERRDAFTGEVLPLPL